MRAAVRSVLFSAIQGIDLDFVRGRYASNSGYRGDFLGLPGATYTRAGAATAETAAGAIINFAANVPRITDRGVLIEEARTNLLPFSSPTIAQMNNVQRLTLTTEPASSPLAGAIWHTWDNNAGGAASGYQSLAVTGSTVYAMSVLCETPDGSSPVVGNSAGTGDFVFVVGGAIVVPSPATYVRLSGNTWRVSATFTSPASPTGLVGMVRYTTQNQRVLKFSGFQIELGAFPTSYIPTTGAAATRAADILLIDNSAAYNALAGTLCAEWSGAPFVGATAVVAGWENASTNADCIRVGVGSDGVSGRGDVRSGNAAQAGWTVGSFVLGGTAKCAVSASLNLMNASCAAVLAAADTSALMPATITRLVVGRSNQSGALLNGYVRSIVYRETALTDAELQALTA